MSWGFIQSAQGIKTTTSSTFGVAFTSANVTLGNRIIVRITITASTVATVTDSAGNSYSDISGGGVLLSTSARLYIYSAIVTAGGGTKPTVTVTTAANAKFAIHVLEYAGTSTVVSDTDGIASGANTSTTTTPSIGPSSPAPGAANELVISAIGDAGVSRTCVPGTGFTQRGTTIQSATVSGAIADQNSVNGTGATGTWTLGTNAPPEALITVVLKLTPPPGQHSVDPYIRPRLRRHWRKNRVRGRLFVRTANWFWRGGGATNTGTVAQTTPLTLALPSVAVGDRVMVLGAVEPNASSPTDTIDHTGSATVDSWTRILGPRTDASGVVSSVWTASVTAAGTMTVRITPGSQSAWMGLAADIYAGTSTAAGAAAVDVSTSAIGSGATASSGATGVTTAANELVWGAYVDQGNGTTPAAGTGWVRRETPTTHTDVNASSEDKDSGASGSTQTATWSSTTGNWAAFVVVLKSRGVGGGGTTTPQVLSVATASSSTLTRQVGKLLTVASASSSSLLKRASKTLGVATASAVSLATAKLKLVILAVATASSVSLAKQIGKVLTVSGASSVSLTKQLAKALAVAAASAVSLAAVKAKFVVLTVASASAVTLTRQVGKALAVSLTSGSTLVKRVSKTISVATSSASTLASIKAKFITLAVSTASSVSLVKSVGKVLVINSASAVSLAKRIAKTLTSAAASAASLAATKAKFVVLAVATASAVTLNRRIGKLVAIATTSQASVIRQIGKMLIVATASGPVLGRTIGKLLSTATSSESLLAALKNVITVGPVSPPVLAILQQAGRSVVTLFGTRSGASTGGGSQASVSGGRNRAQPQEGRDEAETQ